MFVNGSFTNARKFFVFTSEICVCFATTNKINFVNTNRLIIINNSLNNSVCTMPPKRKQSAQKESTKIEKIKEVEELPSRPKRNRAVTSYNEEYSDEFPVTTATIPITKKNAGDPQDGNTEVKVKGKRGRKKKVVPEAVVVPEEKVEEQKSKIEKQDEIDEEPEDVETKGKNIIEKQNEVDEEDVDDDKEVEEEVEEDEEEDEEEEEEEEREVKATKGRKKKEDTVEENPKKNGKEAAKKASAAPKNKTATAYDEINFDDCTRKNDNGKEWNFKISNWNVDGIRAWINKGGLDYIKHEKPDILCVQETKCSEDKLPEEAKEVDGYKVYWVCSEKDGYAGVGLYTKIEPISVEYGINDKEQDNEGRVITAEFEKFYVISVYVPNSGRGLSTLPKRLKWNESFRKFVAELDKKKPVIVCGDMNVSHLEIDLANPKTNTKNAGFTKEERDGMTEFLSDGYVDTFRKIYPDKTQAYTFWTYMANCRAKNIGWRLDYFIVSERFMDNICDNIIRNQVFGSDHCPLTLFLNV